MQEIQAGITYFAKAGRENTQPVLALAQERIDALGIRRVLVATTTGGNCRPGSEPVAAL